MSTGNLGIVDRFENLDDRRLEIASGAVHWLRTGVAGEEACEIVALALHAVGHAGAGRRADRFHLFRLDFPFLVHDLKIRFTCSIPRTSAAMSELSLCAAKLARAVASMPSQRIKGCAQ